MAQDFYIVGEKFACFIESNDAVIGINTFLQAGENKQLKNGHYKIGQGLSREELQKIIALKEAGIHIECPADALEEKHFVHKKEDKNVMITKPVRLGENTFKSYVLLDDNCAEMSDHVTGQHLQGIVILEAARQMMLATTEHYLLNPYLQNNPWVILNDIIATFSGFLFPIEIEVIHNVEIVKSSPQHKKIQSHTYFRQKGAQRAEVKIAYSVYNKAWLANRETNMATALLNEI